MPEGLVFGHQQCAHELKLEAHERLTAMQFDMLNQRLDRLEELIERLEKRLWLTVYGVAAVIIAQGAQSLMGLSP